MHPISFVRRPRLWGLILLAGLVGTVATAQPPKKMPKAEDIEVDAKTGTLTLPVGVTRRFDPSKIDSNLKNQVPTAVLIEREDVLQWFPDPDAPGVLFLTGRVPGATRLVLSYKDRPNRTFEVVVQTDYELLRNLIRRTVPTANVDVTPGIGNVVILGGYVTSPQDADIIMRLATSQVGGAQNVINAMQVGGVQQVQIDVVIASVDRNEIRSRGFDFTVAGQTVNFSSLVSGLLVPPVGGVGGGIAQVSPNANLQLGVAPASFFGALRALRTEGLAKFLAEPRVVTQTGRPAYFLAGGRQAVLGPSSGINGPGVQFQQVGTQLEVLPIVYGNNQIWLEINPQVRAVNQGLGITTVFGTTPGFTEQQARVAVMLESGQTFAIGGLIQNSIQASSSRVPVLGDLPFVGPAFSRIDYEERESELVILVTPRLVHPMDCNQVPRRLPGRETRTPDDYELFLEGILEAPRGQRKVFNGLKYNAAYKCDPTIGAIPCIGDLCYGPNGTAIGSGACGPNGCAPGGAVNLPPVPATPAAMATGSTGTGTTTAPAPLPVTLPSVPGATSGGRGPVAAPGVPQR